MLLVASADNVRFVRRTYRDYNDRKYEATALEVAGHVISNLIDKIQWDCHPTQVQPCEADHEPGCALGGWIDCVRLGEHLLWAPPFPAEQESEAAEHVVIIPATEWHGWRGRHRRLPPFESFPLARRIHLLGVWLQTAPVPRDPETFVPNLRKRLIACDTLDVDVALQEIERLVGESSRPLGGRLRTADTERRVESLYLEAPGQVAFEWPALSVGRTVDVALGDWVFEPDG